MTLTEAVFGVCGQWLCEFIEATPRTGEVTMNQSGSLRASGWLQRWRCLLMLRIRGPKFQAGLMKVLTLMSTLLMNILESRSFREQAESVLNGPGNGGGSLVLLRLDLMKSLATQVGLGSACGQMWPVWTIWGQHLSCSLCPRVKTNTCFMCCCDGCGERAEECGPVTPPSLFSPPSPPTTTTTMASFSLSLNAVLMNIISEPVVNPLLLCLLAFICGVITYYLYVGVIQHPQSTPVLRRIPSLLVLDATGFKQWHELAVAPPVSSIYLSVPLALEHNVLWH